ncbi:unnamed protein product [Adineta steineri]|uniref:Poly [ADP-ribose] polymerase n=1 Tax=Adineta steineri TaxID=433720 RepID=A0A814QSD7_9BILA|nr:unnamed protein product [Adineta steineri]CAF1123572.1 unnamed protein product [Adineta steineri]
MAGRKLPSYPDIKPTTTIIEHAKSTPQQNNPIFQHRRNSADLDRVSNTLAHRLLFPNTYIDHPDKDSIKKPAKTSSRRFLSKLFKSEKPKQTPVVQPIPLTIGNGLIEIEKGDITKQTMDVIIVSSSSKKLCEVLLEAAGYQTYLSYIREYENNPNSLLISAPPGLLSCKRIFFVKWEPDNNNEILRQSVIDLISTVVQNVRSYNYTSIAFSAIGCEGHACSVDVVVKTMVREMKQHIQTRKLSWTVKFIIPADQQNVYDEFCRQLLLSDHLSGDYPISLTRQQSENEQLRTIVPKNTDEYNSIIDKFLQSMTNKYTQIIKLERIQNLRWHMQYMAHWEDFRKRLNKNTEKRLYHGCPSSAADSIIQDCFNRSFAGVNGTLYGLGVYFSSNAAYSHAYTKTNAKGERCMFVARVLVGKTIKGNSYMKTRPFGYDSTTDGDHITVTYHDAQAYAEYLITYK